MSKVQLIMLTGRGRDNGTKGPDMPPEESEERISNSMSVALLEVRVDMVVESKSRLRPAEFPKFPRSASDHPS